MFAPKIQLDLLSPVDTILTCDRHTDTFTKFSIKIIPSPQKTDHDAVAPLVDKDPWRARLFTKVSTHVFVRKFCVRKNTLMNSTPGLDAISAWMWRPEFLCSVFLFIVACMTRKVSLPLPWSHIELLLAMQFLIDNIHYPIFLYTGWAKKRVDRLMTIILSNLNRFTIFFHWKIPGKICS